MDGLAMTAAATLAVQRNAPVLCVDTCSLLDVLRAPMRSAGVDTIAAADRLLQAQQTGRLTMFLASSTLPEFARNEDSVKQELARHLSRLDDEFAKAADCLKQCGSSLAPVSVSSSQLQGCLEGKYSALLNACYVLEIDDQAQSRAMHRIVHQLRPSRKGSGFDANIIEHYLILGLELKRVGFGEPFAFVSSNTADYCEAKGTLHADLSADFRAVSLEYTASLPWSESALGL